MSAQEIVDLHNQMIGFARQYNIADSDWKYTSIYADMRELINRMKTIADRAKSIAGMPYNLVQIPIAAYSKALNLYNATSTIQYGIPGGTSVEIPIPVTGGFKPVTPEIINKPPSNLIWYLIGGIGVFMILKGKKNE